MSALTATSITMQILKSPVTGKPMSKVALDQGLEAFHCPDSGGHYIPAACYMQWLEKQPARLPHLPEADSGIEAVNDSSTASPDVRTFVQRVVARNPSGDAGINSGGNHRSPFLSSLDSM